jgi:hypothetical protein
VLDFGSTCMKIAKDGTCRWWPRLYLVASSATLDNILPIMSPQSPYQNSGIIWYLFQEFSFRKYRDQGPDRKLKAVDTNMALGQMQLAMKETTARKGRDARAIRWLIDNLTEKLLLIIPGSFNTDWGAEVWDKVGKANKTRAMTKACMSLSGCGVTRVSTAQATPQVDRPSPTKWSSATTNSPVRYRSNAHPNSATAHIQGDALLELSKRVNHSLVICKNPGLFEKKDRCSRSGDRVRKNAMTHAPVRDSVGLRSLVLRGQGTMDFYPNLTMIKPVVREVQGLSQNRFLSFLD